MSLDRAAYNISIDQLEAASSAHKIYRAQYIKEIRELGTTLRKKLCQKGGLTDWLTTSFEVNDANPNYGVDVCFQGCRPECVAAITSYLQENGWSNVKAHSIDKYCSRIRAY